MAFEISNEMHINSKDVPPWIPGKHYFEQSLSTIQYWENEILKLKHGITIGGYWVHPWMYFHLNFFKTPIPVGKGVDKVMVPPLDDLTFLYMENYKEAEKDNEALTVFGTRGGTKTTLSVSNCHFKMVTTTSGRFSIVGGNAGDLKTISSLLKKTLMGVEPALYLPTLKADWESQIIFGYKENSGEKRTHIHGEIEITNVNDGKEKEAEKIAGLSQIGYINDEIGKYNFLDGYEAATPGFKNSFGYRLVPLLTGTSGNMKLVKTASKVVMNPSAYGIRKNDWDLLKRTIGDYKADILLDDGKEVCTIIPGEMSRRLETPKIKTNFADFLGIKDKGLKAIPFERTDWENASKEIVEITGPNVERKTAERNTMYYPRRVSHFFLTDSSNPMNTHVISERIQFLEDKGSIKRKVDIFSEGSTFKAVSCDREEAGDAYKGSPLNPPTLLFEPLPELPYEKYIIAAGLDDYKLNESSTASWGSMYFVKRRNIDVNQPCEVIVASITGRPETHSALHQQMQSGVEAFGAEVLIEYVDTLFENHMTLNNKAVKHLAPSMSFSNSKDQMSKSSTRKYGLPSTEGNKEVRMNNLIDWTYEKYPVGEDEHGNTIYKYTIDYIDDIELLQEMLNYRKGGNFDRLDAFSHALLLCKHWDDESIRPVSTRKKHLANKKPEKRNVAEKNPYGLKYRNKINPYGKRR